MTIIDGLLMTFILYLDILFLVDVDAFAQILIAPWPRFQWNGMCGVVMGGCLTLCVARKQDADPNPSHRAQARCKP